MRAELLGAPGGCSEDGAGGRALPAGPGSLPPRGNRARVGDVSGEGPCVCR